MFEQYLVILTRLLCDLACEQACSGNEQIPLANEFFKTVFVLNMDNFHLTLKH